MRIAFALCLCDHVSGLIYDTVVAATYVDRDFSVVDTVEYVSGKLRACAVVEDEIIPVDNKALISQYAHVTENINKYFIISI